MFKVLILILGGLFVVATAYVVNTTSSLPLWQQFILTLIPPILWSTVGYIFGQWEIGQLFLHHASGWLFNRQTRWTFSATFSVKNSKSDLERAKNIALTLAESKIWQDDSTQKVIKSKWFAIRIYSSPGGLSEEIGEDSDALVCQFADLLVPYRSSNTILRDGLFSLFTRLENELAPISQKYEIRIALDPARNPYYGFFVKQVPSAMMREFALSFQIPKLQQKHTIQVKKDSISISARNVSTLQKIAIHYVSLSASPLPESPSSAFSR